MLGNIKNFFNYHINGVHNTLGATAYIMSYLKLMKEHAKLCKDFLTKVLWKYITGKDKLFGESIKNVFNSSSYFIILYVYEFANLIGRPLRKMEKEFSIIISGLMQTYDKLYDDLKLPSKYIDKMLKSYRDFEPQHPVEGATIDLYTNLIERIPGKDRQNFETLISKMHKAQMDSMKQESNDLDIDEVMDITSRKGGYNGIILIYNLIPRASRLVKDLVYQLGVFAQLMDDANDKEIDKKNHILTFATHPDFPISSLQYLDNFRKNILLKLSQIKFPEKRKRQYAFRFYTLTSLVISAFRLKESKYLNKVKFNVSLPFIKIPFIIYALLLSLRDIYNYNYERISHSPSLNLLPENN